MASTEHYLVGRRVLQGLFGGEGDRSGLRRWRQGWWLWENERWVSLDEEILGEMVRLFLRGAKCPGGEQGFVSYKVDSRKVTEVLKELSASQRVEVEEMPAWVGTIPEGFSRGATVGFKDVCVDARTMQAVPRGKEWFDAGVLPVVWNPEAKCERWERCVAEWGEGDPEWGELLARWMGYCLMGSRREAKWLLLQGKIRGGKGTICRVIQRLVGKDAYMSVSLEDLASEHGLWGLEKAKVLSVTEVSDLGRREGEAACRVLKNVVGRDPITINGKWEKLQRNVVVGAAPMMSSNQIPQLPNKSRGLSGKMLVLPFGVSFEGKEDLGLEDELDRELEGIAAWALRGAHRLETREGGVRWPEPRAAKRVVEDYVSVNNPVDSFLKACFVQRPDGFVSKEVVRSRWREWVEMMGVRMHIPKNELIRKVLEGSTWDLKVGRLSHQQGGDRGIRGMVPRMVIEDDE